jgi:hypothetical protein
MLGPQPDYLLKAVAVVGMIESPRGGDQPKSEDFSTLLTHLCHSTINFAVMQQQRFRIAVW